MRGDAGLRALRTLAGGAAVLVLLLPQVATPHRLVELFETSGSTSPWLWRIVVNALVSLVFLPVLRPVSYRRRDWLVLAFVPIWQWVVAFRIGYRAALLPLRDWAPRPDERLRVLRLPGGAGARLSVLVADAPPSALPRRDVVQRRKVPVRAAGVTTTQVTRRSPAVQPAGRGPR